MLSLSEQILADIVFLLQSNKSMSKAMKERLERAQKKKEEEAEQQRIEREKKKQEHDEKLRKERERQQEKLRRLNTNESIGIECKFYCTDKQFYYLITLFLF